MTPEMHALRQACELCKAHAMALREAMEDLAPELPLAAGRLSALGKALRRTLDQFAYRYTRLQDDMGARLFPSILRVLGEEVSAMAAVDRFNRLEQLGWLLSADEWIELRRIRNEFTHDYPESAEDRAARLGHGIHAAGRILEVFDELVARIGERFGAVMADE